MDEFSQGKKKALISRAMRLLSQRDHSDAEMRRKLAAHSFVALVQFETIEQSGAAAVISSPLVIEHVIAYCYQNNWLDDGRFSTHFIASRVRKGYGSQRIRMELMQRGVEKQVIQAALVACEIDWCEHARQIAQRKFGDPLPLEWTDKVKVQRYLLSRGFGMEEIQAIYRDFVQ